MSGFDPELPWGYHLSVVPNPGWQPQYVDAAGNEYTSVRDAFWVGRLRLPRPVSSEVLELIHALFASLARAPNDSSGRFSNLFGGERCYQHITGIWLAKEGLVTVLDDDDDGSANGLTNEGWSALHMLHATRPVDVRHYRPSYTTVQQLTELGLGLDGRAERLARVDLEVGHWNAAFKRIHMGERPAIKLDARGSGPIPAMQAVWTMVLHTEVERDSVYDWLVSRMDRWGYWAALAAEEGGPALTHQLLVLMSTETLVCSRSN